MTLPRSLRPNYYRPFHTRPPVASLYFVPHGPYYYKAFALISRERVPFIRLHSFVFWSCLPLPLVFLFPDKTLSSSATYLFSFCLVTCMAFLYRSVWILKSKLLNRGRHGLLYRALFKDRERNRFISWLLLSFSPLTYYIPLSLFLVTRAAVSFHCHHVTSALHFSISRFTCEHM